MFVIGKRVRQANRPGQNVTARPFQFSNQPFTHVSQEEAEREAARLAAENPLQEFIVFSPVVVAAAEASPVVFRDPNTGEIRA